MHIKRSLINHKTYIALASLFIAFFVSAQDDIRIDATVKAIRKALPSVVNIGTEKIVNSAYSPWGGTDPFEGFFRDYFAEQITQKVTSLGSGSIIDPEGLVITNAHVVHRATVINVVMSDGKSYTAREVASNDLSDIALIQIDLSREVRVFEPISIAKPEELYLGETVIAVGNPYGLGSSISRGVLSAIARNAVYDGKVIFSDILQTDAAVNPGNSGGPLINIKGEMIGMNTAIYKEAQGIGFAIPVRRIEAVVAKWLIPERFSDVSLGIIPDPVCGNDGICEFRIGEVIEGSPAWNAGLRGGEKIISMNGKPFLNFIDVGRILWKVKDGDTIVLGDSKNRKFELKAKKMLLKDGKETAKQRLGIGLVELNAKIADSIDYPLKGGLLVSSPPPNIDSVARGEVLVRINDTIIHDFEDVTKALENVRYGEAVNALFIRLVKRGGNFYAIKRVVVLEAK